MFFAVLLLQHDVLFAAPLLQHYVLFAALLLQHDVMFAALLLQHDAQTRLGALQGGEGLSQDRLLQERCGHEARVDATLELLL